MISDSKISIIEKYLKDIFDIEVADEGFVYLDVKDEYFDQVHDILIQYIDYVNNYNRTVFEIGYEDVGTFYIKFNQFTNDSLFEEKIRYLKTLLI